MLTETQRWLDQQTIPETTNYNSLLDNALCLELDHEIHKLTLLINQDDHAMIKEGFKDLCKQRNTLNAHKAFGFFALPEGRCNQLYWQFTMILFEPKPLKSLFEILFPSIQYLYTIEVAYSKDQFYRYKAHLNCKKVAIPSTNRGIHSSDILKQWITDGNSLLDLNDIANFNFELHKAFSQFLALENSKIYEQLFQHNEALKQLGFDLGLMSHSISAREAIIKLKRSFILAGEKYSGNEKEADLSGSIAFNTFLAYLEQLSSDFKEAFLQMTTGEITLDKLIQQLKKPKGVSNCVELASIDLEKILKHPENQQLLDITSQLAREDKYKIINKYKNKSLPIEGKDPAKKIPRI